MWESRARFARAENDRLIGQLAEIERRPEDLAAENEALREDLKHFERGSTAKVARQRDELRKQLEELIAQNSFPERGPESLSRTSARISDVERQVLDHINKTNHTSSWNEAE